MQLFSAIHTLTPLLVGILWTCLCRSGCIALNFEVLPMLISVRNLVCLMEVLMLRKEMKYMCDIAENDQKQKILELLREKYVIAEDWQGRQGGYQNRERAEIKMSRDSLAAQR